VDPNSEDGQALRKRIPLNTIPSRYFNDLCTKINVNEVSAGSFLFHKADPTTAFIYLLQGSISLESGSLKIETITANSDAAKFAIAHQFPRKISARALDNVRYVNLALDAFDCPELEYQEKESTYMVDNNEDPETQASDDWMSTLLKSPIFQRLPAMNLQRVLMSLENIELKKGDIIFQQGDIGDYYYLIKKGRCALSRQASKRSKAIKLFELSDNDTFGEDSLLSGEPRSMTITAVTDMLLSRIDKKAFITLIKEPALTYIEPSQLQHELAQEPNTIFLDIRTGDEYKQGHITGSRNIPFFSLRMHIKELKRETKKIILICADGTLSEAAAFILINNKLDAIIVKGGMQHPPFQTNITRAATFTIDETDNTHNSVSFERNSIADDETKISQVLDGSRQSDTEIIHKLKQKNQDLTAELDALKKQYRILYKQTEKLKSVLDKHQKGEM